MCPAVGRERDPVRRLACFVAPPACIRMIEPDGVVAAQGEQTVYAVFEAPQDGAFRVGLVGRPTVLIWTILRCGISTMRVRLIAALTWRSPVRERVRSFAIITTTPNELCAEIHNRMPVVLEPAAWPTWLGEEPADARLKSPARAPGRTATATFEDYQVAVVEQLARNPHQDLLRPRPGVFG